MKLYVGNLPYQTTDAELQEFFAPAGAVNSASVLRDKFTGRSRGFGFVEMNDADGKKAIDMFHGKDFQGRPLVVNEARPMEARAPRQSFDRGGDRDRDSRY